MGKIGVYEIKNIINGKRYIGSTKDIDKRFKQHKVNLNNGSHLCLPLQRSWNKYGSDNFEFNTLVTCETEEDSRVIEQEYLDKEFDELYNLSKTSAGGDNISYHPNRSEIVKKIRNGVVQRYANMSKEEKIEKHGKFGSTNGMFGRHHTEETIKKLSDINKGNTHALGYKWTDEQKAKLSKVASERIGDKNPFYGKVHTKESKEKMSLARIGIKPSNSKKVCIDGVLFESATDAAKQLKCAVATIGNRCKSEKFPNYTYLES